MNKRHSSWSRSTRACRYDAKVSAPNTRFNSSLSPYTEKPRPGPVADFMAKLMVQDKRRHASPLVGLGTENTQLSKLFHLVEQRSQVGIMRELANLERLGLDRTLNDVQLEHIVRAFRPLDSFNTPTTKEPWKVYQDHMNFCRSWLMSLRKDLPPSIWFLLLEQGRISKLHNSRCDISDRTWADMERAGTRPDVYCYNSYIAASCSQPALVGYARLRRKNEKQETQASREERIAEAERKVQHVVKLYRQMLKQAVEPNAMTIELLLLGLGRSANFSAMGFLVLQTWGLRLPKPAFLPMSNEGVMDEYDEEEIDMDGIIEASSDASILSPGDALYPTQETLKVLANAYGANTQCELATAAVRMMARSYRMKITPAVWTRLMKWAAANATIHKGFVPTEYCEELFNLATKEYHCRPSISMYHQLAAHALARDRKQEEIYDIVDQMLVSVQGNGQIDRPNFRASKLYKYSRKIVVKVYLKLCVRSSYRIAQIENRISKLKSSDTDLGRISLLETDLARRKQFLHDMQAKWIARVSAFDTLMGQQVSAQASASVMKAGAT